MTALWIARQGQPDRTPELCRMLAERNINITFMACTTIGDLHPALCCVEEGDKGDAAALIHQNPQLNKVVRIAEQSVGLLSVYPHRASLNVLGTTLLVLRDLDIAVHSLASSIAALTFVIDFDSIAKAVTALAGTLKLSADQIVHQSEYRIKQIMPAGSGQPPLQQSSLTEGGGA